MERAFRVDGTFLRTFPAITGHAPETLANAYDIVVDGEVQVTVELHENGWEGLDCHIQGNSISKHASKTCIQKSWRVVVVVIVVF
jgi:hypothetical protein